MEKAFQASKLEKPKREYILYVSAWISRILTFEMLFPVGKKHFKMSKLREIQHPGSRYQLRIFNTWLISASVKTAVFTDADINRVLKICGWYLLPECIIFDHFFNERFLSNDRSSRLSAPSTINRKEISIILIPSCTVYILIWRAL